MIALTDSPNVLSDGRIEQRRLTFQGFGGELFILVGNHVDAERELIDSSPLTSQIVNTDLGIGDTPRQIWIGKDSETSDVISDRNRERNYISEWSDRSFFTENPEALRPFIITFIMQPHSISFPHAPGGVARPRRSNSPAKPRLGIRFVLAVPIAPRRPATHF